MGRARNRQLDRNRGTASTSFWWHDEEPCRLGLPLQIRCCAGPARLGSTAALFQYGPTQHRSSTAGSRLPPRRHFLDAIRFQFPRFWLPRLWWHHSRWHRPLVCSHAQVSCDPHRTRARGPVLPRNPGRGRVHPRKRFRAPRPRGSRSRAGVPRAAGARGAGAVDQRVARAARPQATGAPAPPPPCAAARARRGRGPARWPTLQRPRRLLSAGRSPFEGLRPGRGELASWSPPSPRPARRTGGAAHRLLP